MSVKYYDGTEFKDIASNSSGGGIQLVAPNTNGWQTATKNSTNIKSGYPQYMCYNNVVWISFSVLKTKIEVDTSAGVPGRLELFTMPVEYQPSKFFTVDALDTIYAATPNTYLPASLEIENGSVTAVFNYHPQQQGTNIPLMTLRAYFSYSLV
jgi:hypothetical protein